ncbi:hypothetical protein G7043_41185 [Lentzea sp. NEAU-D13]|uniref:Transferase n=1 Tax=Lentzea alba TaxID=2714351 RepID=A0A7C9RXH3_9PSEU|nr:hypothetical protein [Lentzea alba]NGY65328.1 hypothetical protein [Lentzea alba]
MTKLVLAVTVVYAYLAAWLVVGAVSDTRERNAFQDAPNQVAALCRSLEQGIEPTLVYNWFIENAPGTSKSRFSVGDATHAAGRGDFAEALSYCGDLDSQVAEDRRSLEEKAATSWSQARTSLFIGTLLAIAAAVLLVRRRAANAKTVAIVSSYMRPRAFWRRPASLLVSGISAVLLYVGTFSIMPLLRSGQVLWVIPVVAVLPTAYFVLRYARPWSARGAAQVLRSDERVPVLYLRGFGDDRGAAVVDVPRTLLHAALTVHSREEELVSALRAFGPVIAVGRPNERLPRLGAARFYLPQNDWKQGVRELMDQCQLIVLRLAPGEGLWWEVEQARTTQPPEKLVLLVPGDCQDLTARLHHHLPKAAAIVPDPGKWTGSVIVFDHEWTPIVEAVGPPPDKQNLVGSPAAFVVRALHFALKRVGRQKRLMTYRTGSGMVVTLGKVLLVFPAAALGLMVLRLFIDW